MSNQRAWLNPFGKSSIRIKLDQSEIEEAKILAIKGKLSGVLCIGDLRATLEWTEDEIYARICESDISRLYVFQAGGVGFLINEFGQQVSLTWA